MDRVLAIGGTGKVGRNVVTQLTERGEQAVVFAGNPETAKLTPQVEKFEAISQFQRRSMLASTRLMPCS